MTGEKVINETVKTQSLLDNYCVFTVSLVLNGVVITQSLLHVGELCKGTTGGNGGSGRSWRVGKEMATCVAVVGDGMVGVGVMTSCRDGNVR